MGGTGSGGRRNGAGRKPKTRDARRLSDSRAQTRPDGVVPTPPVVVGVLEPPIALSGVARAEWDRMLARLGTLGTLSTADDGALYQYCCMFAETEALAVSQAETRASIAIMEENIHGIERSEVVQVFQEITKLRQLEAGYSTKIRQGRMGLRSYLAEFGLTPATRNRVKVPTPEKEADGFAQFDGGPA